MTGVHNLLLCIFAGSIAACASASSPSVSNETWGLILEPVDIWSGNNDEQVMIWSSRYYPDVFGSEAACLQAAKEQTKEHPPGENMSLTCTSPHPNYRELDVPIDTDEIDLE